MGRRAAGDRREPLCRLIRFEATDGVSLSGLLYGAPASAGRVIVWLHGTGGASVFESSRTNLLARVFLNHRIAFFPFNNRGAHYVRRAGRHFGGSAFERIRECVHDIDGAIRELRRRGFTDITLAGHSTGANKIAVYDHYRRRNRVKRYVLVAGADDAGLEYKEFGAQRFRAYLKKARSLKNTLMPGRMMTWRAFYDMANPNGDYNVFPFDPAVRGRRPFRFIHGITKPALYIYGEHDEFGFDAALLAEHVGPRGEIVVIRDADHGFSGKEEELATLIADWTTAEARA
ncbi:MAG TPA: alpha/beta hydrolase [Thermoanaerobaculia bacterium]|nr:alpha/beta hydrolase [Thermoanaerobaculia bacterium]